MKSSRWGTVVQGSIRNRWQFKVYQGTIPEISWSPRINRQTTIVQTRRKSKCSSRMRRKLTYRSETKFKLRQACCRKMKCSVSNKNSPLTYSSNTKPSRNKYLRRNFIRSLLRHEVCQKHNHNLNHLWRLDKICKTEHESIVLHRSVQVLYYQYSNHYRQRI